MTLASEIIASAFREANLIAVGASPTAAEQAEALALLGRILPATIGSDAGDELAEVNIGGQWGEHIEDHVPANARLALNLSGPMTLRLDPRPHDGQRLAMIDVAGNLPAAPLTLDANGRRIEGSTSISVNIARAVREWLYRADLGDWRRITALDAASEMPFPTEFDDYMSILLAMRLNPRFGREMAQSSRAWLDGMASRMQARYRRPRPPQDYAAFGVGRLDWRLS